MSDRYQIPALSETERERLERTYSDLMELASSQVPSVRAAARAAVAHVAQALNGEGLGYYLYTTSWEL
jgi:hypothetical protein